MMADGLEISFQKMAFLPKALTNPSLEHPSKNMVLRCQISGFCSVRPANVCALYSGKGSNRGPFLRVEMG
jgi:hypothetical protein